MSPSASSPPPTAATCLRCKTAHSTTYTLRQEPHCRSCYATFIRTKLVKRLESYNLIRRTRPRANEPDTLPLFLVPLSFGIASSSLLDLLAWHLSGQKAHRTGVRYRVVVCHVNEDVLHGSGKEETEGAWEEFQKRYEGVVDEWIKVRLEDVYGYADDVEELKGSGDKEEGDKGKRLRALMTALPSPTSRMDLAAVLRTRLVVEVAKGRKCEGVLWGDTTTKLAQRTLAETAKGRGFAIPMMVCDETVAYGMKFLYPLREVFMKELVVYARDIIVDPPLMPLCTEYSAEPKHSVAKATSGRNITVDELMTQYFEQMEEQYPHIVSNVIRTASRLKVQSPEAKACSICGLPGDGGKSALTLGDFGEDGEEASGASDMCYGCLRSTHNASASIAWPL